VLFCQPFKKNNNEPEKHKPKKQKKQETKNKNKKNNIAHPKVGVVAESWVLSFCFCCFSCFFVSWFFVLFSHCRYAKQKLSMVAQ
jgi:hypothetical protein